MDYSEKDQRIRIKIKPQLKIIVVKGISLQQQKEFEKLLQSFEEFNTEVFKIQYDTVYSHPIRIIASNEKDAVRLFNKLFQTKFNGESIDC